MKTYKVALTKKEMDMITFAFQNEDGGYYDENEKTAVIQKFLKFIKP